MSGFEEEPVTWYLLFALFFFCNKNSIFYLNMCKITSIRT